MNMVYKGFGLLKNMYNQLNPATLTGAIDILVVEQPDGSLVASPFHVRFGKLGVLRAKEKLVNIAINGDRVKDLHMKLGDQGEAFFVEKIDEEEAIPLRLMTSPLPSRPSTPTKSENPNNFEEPVFGESGKRKRRRKRKKKSQPPNAAAGGVGSCSEEEEKLDVGNVDDNVIEIPESNRSSSHSSADYRDSIACASVPELRISLYDSAASDCSVEIMGTWEDSPDDDNLRSFTNIRCVQSDSEVPNLELHQGLDCPFSDSEATNAHQDQGMMWGWGQLPGDNERSQDSSSSSDDVVINMQDTDVDPNASQPQDALHIENEVIKTEEKILKDEGKSKANASQPPRVRKDTEGLYLDDVLSLTPSEANLYLQGVPKDNQVGKEASEPPASPHASDFDSGTDSQTQDDQTYGPCLNDEVMMSLCGLPSASTEPQSDKFQEKLVTYDQFAQNAVSILNDPNLVVKFGDQYLTWQNAVPVITAMAVFKKPIDVKSIERLIQPSSTPPPQGSRLMGWLWRRPKSESTAPPGDDAGSAPASQPPTNPLPRKHQRVGKSLSEAPSSRTLINPRGRRQTEQTSDDHDLSIIMEPELKRSQSAEDIYSRSTNEFLATDTLVAPQCLKTMRKTTRLTHEQLDQLNLENGANTITFSVTTQYQGTTRCMATIYKWKWCDRIVVSDIDGTITKSDVFGQILPVVGKDWTQGGVAQLYQNISKNGYKFIYVSSRAIGQASMTKDYLNWINQQGVSLPPGPLLLSPTSLVSAFKREVIEKKPEKFKIACLKDIQALFPSNPFVAGFGNKTNDVCAYSAVGVPSNRMFTINHKGELKQELLQTYTTSYSGLGDSVDNFFPPLDQDQGFDRAHEFSTFTFWREEIVSFADDLEKFE